MAKKINYTPEELLNLKFSPKEKGYNPLEVDQTFDKMIEDYNLLLSQIKELSNNNDKHLEENEALKDEISKLQVDFAKLKKQFDLLPKAEGLNQDNVKLMRKINAYERVLWRKGIDPKKALSDPDNC